MALLQDVRKFVLTTLKMFAVSNKLALAETFSNHTFFAVVVFQGFNYSLDCRLIEEGSLVIARCHL